jgi:lipoprotein NlpD
MLISLRPRLHVRHRLRGALAAVMVSLLAACASGPPAPIVSRTSPGSPTATAPAAAGATSPRPAAQAAPNASAPRQTPDVAGAQSAPVRSGSIDSKAIESRPLGSTPASPAAPASPASGAASSGTTPGAATAAPAPIKPTPPAEATRTEIEWGWPSAGRVVQTFDDSNSKGMSFSTTAGESVMAAAEGRVIFSGVGPRGYGNLVIVKHSNDLLSVYAHNRSLLVKEGTTVKRGQKIAEAGDSSGGTQRLHFEIRQQGKPVDPAKFLPKR